MKETVLCALILVVAALADYRSLTVFNNGSYYAQIFAKFELPDGVKAREATHLYAGRTKTVMIPEEATDVQAMVSYMPRYFEPEYLFPDQDNSAFGIFNMTVPGPGAECYKIWGTDSDRKYAKIDC